MKKLLKRLTTMVSTLALCICVAGGTSVLGEDSFQTASHITLQDNVLYNIGQNILGGYTGKWEGTPLSNGQCSGKGGGKQIAADGTAEFIENTIFLGKISNPSKLESIDVVCRTDGDDKTFEFRASANPVTKNTGDTWWTYPAAANITNITDSVSNYNENRELTTVRLSVKNIPQGDNIYLYVGDTNKNIRKSVFIQSFTLNYTGGSAPIITPAAIADEKLGAGEVEAADAKYYSAWRVAVRPNDDVVTNVTSNISLNDTTKSHTFTPQAPLTGESDYYFGLYIYSSQTDLTNLTLQSNAITGGEQ